MKPQVGKRYVRADGEITDYLVLKRVDSGVYLYDKHHDAYYITTKDMRNESEATDPNELVAEYHEPDTTKTVKRWQWVAGRNKDGTIGIMTHSTEKEAMATAVSKEFHLFGRIQESLIETEE